MRERRRSRGTRTARVGAHHGELLQGMFEAPDGTLQHGLVTLPCELFWSRAVFMPVTVMRGVQVTPASRTKARRAAELALHHLGVHGGGELAVTTGAPEGWGLGSSTSDVTATILAVHRAYAVTPDPDAVARLAVRAETASDPLMHTDQPVLFAQRWGMVLERFTEALPPLEVLGCNPDPGAGALDTLGLPPAAYSTRQTRAFEELRSQLRQAIERQDAGLLGDVTTASAIINQAHLAQACFEQIRRLGRATGSVGLQIAHSGRVVGLLFDAADPECRDRVAMAERRLAAALPEAPRWRFPAGGRAVSVY